MNQQPTENDIKKLLEHLNYPSQVDIMQQQVFFIQTEAIRQQRINDERVIAALMNISANTSSDSARKEVNKTLKYLGITPPSIDIELVNWQRIGILAGLIPGVIFFVLFLTIWDNVETLPLICFGSVGIPSGMLGAAIGRRSNKAAWIGAVLGAILGAGLWLLCVISMPQ